MELKGADAVIGWSLGALYLMDAVAGGLQIPGRLILLAPFIAFCSEHDRGGRCSLPQLKWLRRWVERDREAALEDFYERAGIVGVDPARAPNTELLIAGLERLGHEATPDVERWGLASVPRREVVIGEQDRLLDAQHAAKCFSGSRVVPGAGHSAVDLLQACPEVLDAV